MKFLLAPAAPDDVAEIAALHREVAAHGGGLARAADEIDVAQLAAVVARACATGVALVAREPAGGAILGEIHAAALTPRVFAHVLGELTIAVRPAQQGRGVGRALFERLLAEVRDRRPEILRVELFVRESNVRAIRLYESLGFRIEGRLAGRIRRADGACEADLVMGRSPSDR